jgi:F0F1-type ATP synthase membrane subunit b/b'
MDSFLSIKPGLLVWSVINFLFFLLALYFIGGKKFIKNIKDREELIKQAIDAAEVRKFSIQKLAEENDQKLKETIKIID